MTPPNTGSEANDMTILLCHELQFLILVRVSQQGSWCRKLAMVVKIGGAELGAKKTKQHSPISFDPKCKIRRSKNYTAMVTLSLKTYSTMFYDH